MRKQTDTFTYTIGVIALIATMSEYCFKHVERNTHPWSIEHEQEAYKQMACAIDLDTNAAWLYSVLLVASRLIYKQK